MKWFTRESSVDDPVDTESEPVAQNTEPLRQSDVAKLYERPPSFTDLLPWVEYIPDSQCFLLEDGISVAALLELTPIGSEAREEEFLEQFRDKVQVALSDSLPEDADSPWILQLFVQDAQDLSSISSKLETYGDAEALQSAYSHYFKDVFSEHLLRISAPQGLYEDGANTGSRWRGQIRRIRATLYRRVSEKAKNIDPLEIETELNEVFTRLSASLEVAGVGSRRCTVEDLHAWLLPWFNPAPEAVDGGTAELLNLVRCAAGGELPFGHDLAESFCLSMPRSDQENGVWWFDGLPHTYITVQTLRQIPQPGLLTAERQSGDNLFAVFDHMPTHTVMSMTVQVKSQSEIRNHIGRIKRAAVGDTAEATLAREEADAVERQLARGNKLYPVAMGFFVRANDLAELRKVVNDVHALLLSNGLQPIGRESELLPLDSYIRNLPMAYDPRLDKTRRRSRLMFAKHVSNLLPLYGRQRGTGHSGLVFFNRGAEPFEFDPLNAEDRKKNAHMLVLGPTGAGKSALLVYLLQQMVARYRPRVFIIEAGGSFELLGQHFAEHGLTVNQITLNVDADVSLPPFSDAIQLVAPTNPKDVADGSGFGARDRLGEMEIVARVMITGGDAKEDERLSRSDRLVIRNAILNAARTVQESGRPQVLIDDVVEAMHAFANDRTAAETRRVRIQEMADSMALFCSGVAGHFFNREGESWPDVDVTILEMGLLAREGYEDQLTVAYLSMMSFINDLVEKTQHETRPTLVVTDEGHLITTHPLLANYVVKITKMWRKLGAWFWIATQNLGDFPDASRRMLNMMEWWLCLVMPKEEIDQIARFRELSDAQRLMLLSARKEPGKYVEGVVLSDRLEALFRNVPPALSLALAMSEKHEKAERRGIMDEHGCSEVEAAYRVAERIVAGRN